MVLSLAWPKQHLDHPDVDLLLQQVGGKAVAERVERNPLVDPGRILGAVEDPAQLAGGQRVDRVLARKQPAPRQHHTLVMAEPPPIAQQRQQVVGQHGVTVLTAFTLLDPDYLAGAVDVADLERDHLRGAKPGPIGQGERRSRLQARGMLQKPRHLLGAQDHRQPLGQTHGRHPNLGVPSAQGRTKEKP